MDKTISPKLFNKNFTIIAVGQMISLLGNALQRYSLSLYILDLTGSAAIFSTILALTIIPQIIVAPFGGAIADRISKKNIMVVLDFFSGSLLLVFALLLNQSSHQVLLVGILTCTLSVIQNFYDPSVRASIPAVITSDNLEKSNAIVSQISALTALIGPIAAGVLYGKFGIEGVFIINIISFFISAIMELFLSIPFKKIPFSGNMLVTFSKDIKETFVYLVKEKKIIFYILLFACGTNLVLTPIYIVGVPFVEKIIFHVTDELYGISEGCIGIGMIVGSMFVGIINKVIPFKKLHYHFYALGITVLAMGVPTLGFLCNASGINYVSYILFTIAGFILAFFIAIVNIVSMTFLQLHTPQEKMGKVMALVVAISSALLPIGSVVFGLLYEAFQANLFILYAIVAVITVLSAIVMGRVIKREYHTIEEMEANRKASSETNNHSTIEANIPVDSEVKAM